MKRILALTALAAMLVVTACITSDTQNPTVTIVFPANGATVNRGDIVIKASATDNKSVVKVEFYINGSLTGTDNVGGAGDTFRYTWSDTAAQVAGQNYSLVAKAWDAADNNATSAAVSITIAGGGGGTGPTNHAGRITVDETWWPSGNPHIIVSDVYLEDNATLTIKPGCTVRFRSGTELYCGYGDPGAIVAEGTADSVITFTSDVTPPSPGDWQSVGVFDEAVSTTRFRHCVFEYGGKELGWGALHVQNFSLRFTDCVIRNSLNYGVRLHGEGRFSEFQNNTVTTSGRYPVYAPCEAAGTFGPGNTFTGNTNDGILVRGGTITTTTNWRNHGVPYVIEDDIAVGDDANNPVLTIAPGTTVQLRSGVEFYCGYGNPGGIIADGTGGQITFTSAVNPPSPGDFTNIGLYDDVINSQTKFINCKVEFGGGTGGNLLIRNCTPTVTGCLIRKSASYGIYLTGSEYPDPTTLRANNTFEDNADGDIYEP
jgi:hypothetical protein